MISDSDSKHGKLDWEGERDRASVHSTVRSVLQCRWTFCNEREYYGDSGSLCYERVVTVDFFYDERVSNGDGGYTMSRRRRCFFS